MNTPLITLFTMPKPFSQPQNHTSIIQRNAIASWAKLDDVEVVLVGGEEGIAKVSAELGVQHIDEIEYNELGTPLVNSAFRAVKELSHSPFLAYCNSDVILLPCFVDAVRRMQSFGGQKKMVAFGPRVDLRVEDQLDFNSPDVVESLLRQTATNGRIATQACKEYFVFDRSLYDNLPAFAIGRGNWDNWMIWSAKKAGHLVINLSEWVTAIHQSHDYQHVSANRRNVYVSGEEAKRNEELAGGRHIISGSVGTHRLTRDGLAKEKPLLINRHFWADVPRFMRLVSSLVAAR